MKAAILRTLNSPLTIETEVIVPPLERGQVLVQIAYSGVCRSQLMEVRGARGDDKYLPHLLGHEASGKVTAIGPGVNKVKPGDRVVLGWIKGEGIDCGGTTYQCKGERFNAGAVTTFNEHAVVAENRLTLLPNDIPFDVAVLFGCAVPTGAGIIINSLKPTAGSAIAVFGLGGVGLSALMATQIFNCKMVIAVDVEEEKLKLAREFGATHTLNAKTSDPVREIFALTDGKGVDFSVEAAGHVKTIEQAFACVRKHGGHCVFASHPPYGQGITFDPHDLISGKKIEGSWGGACNPDRDLPLFFDLYRQGRLPLEKLLNRRYGLNEINQALSDMERGLSLRPLLEINPTLV